jgi:hypothetical protein
MKLTRMMMWWLALSPAEHYESLSVELLKVWEPSISSGLLPFGEGKEA